MTIAKVGKVIIDMEKETVEVTGFSFANGDGSSLTEYLKYVVLRKAQDIIQKARDEYVGIEP